MQEKYYIDIDENRKIIGRYLLSIHVENIPNTVQEVTEEVFNISIQENHNYLNEDLTTYYKEIDERTEEEKKQAKIQEINQKAYSDITEVYPEWKQLNIIRNKECNPEAYNEMTLFIDTIRAYADLEIMKLD